MHQKTGDRRAFAGRAVSGWSTAFRPDQRHILLIGLPTDPNSASRLCFHVLGVASASFVAWQPSGIGEAAHNCSNLRDAHCLGVILKQRCMRSMSRRLPSSTRNSLVAGGLIAFIGLAASFPFFLTQSGPTVIFKLERKEAGHRMPARGLYCMLYISGRRIQTFIRSGSCQGCLHQFRLQRHWS